MLAKVLLSRPFPCPCEGDDQKEKLGSVVPTSGVISSSFLNKISKNKDRTYHNVCKNNDVRFALAHHLLDNKWPLMETVEVLITKCLFRGSNVLSVNINAYG